MNEQTLKPLTYVCKLVPKWSLTQNHLPQAETLLAAWPEISKPTNLVAQKNISINKILKQKVHTHYLYQYILQPEEHFFCSQGKSKPLQSFRNLAIKGKNTLK